MGRLLHGPLQRLPGVLWRRGRRLWRRVRAARVGRPPPCLPRNPSQPHAARDSSATTVPRSSIVYRLSTGASGHLRQRILHPPQRPSATRVCPCLLPLARRVEKGVGVVTVVLVDARAVTHGHGGLNLRSLVPFVERCDGNQLGRREKREGSALQCVMWGARRLGRAVRTSGFWSMARRNALL